MYKVFIEEGWILYVGFLVLFILVMGVGKKDPHPVNKDGSCACGNCEGNGNRW